MINQRKKREIIFGVILTGLFFLWMIFFLNKEFVYNCDLRLHYEFALQLPSIFEMGIGRFEEEVKYAHILSYPGWHLLFLLFYNILSNICGLLGIAANTGTLSVISQAILNSLVLILTFYAVVCVYRRYYKVAEKWAWTFGVIIMFVGPLYLHIVNPSYYIGQFTANPWHNPTTFIVKPITIGVFFLYCWIWKKHNSTSTIEVKKQENKLLIIFGLCLLISGYFKPSFYQSFVPALFVFCVIDVFRTKFKNFIFCLKTGIAVFPVCLIALIQYLTSFTAVGNRVILKPFEVWEYFTPHIVGSFMLSMAFPILSFFLCRRAEKKEKFEPSFLLGILFFLSALTQFILFSFEEGWAFGDFVWGVYLATLIVFIIGVNNLYHYMCEKGIDVKGIIATAFLGLHLICGLGYFCACYVLDSFYI